MVRAQAQRSGEVGHDEHAVEQSLDDARDAFVRLHAVERPCGGTFRQRFHLGASGVRDEGFGDDRRDAELLGGEAFDESLGDRLILHEYGLQVVAEGGFDRAGAVVIGLDE